jgi:hypothetical protein
MRNDRMAPGSQWTPRWREMDSNPRSPVGGDGYRVPGPTAPGPRMLEHAGGTADREIALLTGGNGMSRVLRSI